MNELKQERNKRNLSQAGMCNLLNVSIGTYVKWETGQNEPNDINKQVIKDVLGLEV